MPLLQQFILTKQELELELGRKFRAHTRSLTLVHIKLTRAVFTVKPNLEMVYWLVYCMVDKDSNQ